MAEIFSQARKISALKGHMTRIFSKIRTLLLEEDVDKEELTDLKENLYDKRDIYVNEIYNYLDTLVEKGEEERAKELEKDINNMDQKIEDIVSEIDTRLTNSKIKNKPPISLELEPECKLERVSLPKFSGKDYFQWRAIYDVVVHNKPYLDRIKMIRLLSCLEGEPKELIKNFPPVDASYKPAVLRLEEVYGGRERRVADAIKNIRVGRPVDEENLWEVRKFLTGLEAVQVVFSEEGEDVSGHSALFQCAKERLSRTLLRAYLSWTMDQRVSQNFDSLISYLSQWSKIIESAPESSRKARPFVSHAQSISKGITKNYCDSRDTFVPCCIWHQKERAQIERHYLDNCAEFKALSVKDRCDFVFANHLCKVCFRKNHMARTCKNKRALCRKCKNPKNNHHYLLHENRNDSSRIEEVQSSETLESNACNCQYQNYLISLQSVPVFVRAGTKQIKVNALLDSASNSSFLSRGVVEALGLAEFDSQTRIMHTINRVAEPIKVAKVNVQLASIDGRCVRSEQLFSVPNMLTRSQPVTWQRFKEKWSHLKSIKFPKLAPHHHELLIGSDMPFYHRCKKEVVGGANDPVAKLTPLGWTAQGLVDPQSNLRGTEDMMCCKMEMSLDNEVSALWTLESIGIAQPVNEKYVPTQDEKLAEELLDRHLKYESGRYEAPILWKSEAPEGSNFDAVYRRMKAMERRLSRGDVLKRCDDVITDYERKGYIVEIPIDRRYERSFFLPHFPIIKESRTTSKVRIVYDAAAKYDGVSLNDRIYTGPKLQNDILDILLRFRKYKFAVLADVSEMYLQISLSPKDRKFCRFIWQEKIYEWTRLLFGRRDAPYIALKVIQMNAQHFAKQFPVAVEAIMASMYIDDLATSCLSEKDVRDLIHHVAIIFERASMKICKWNSNSRIALESVPVPLRAQEADDIFKQGPPVSGVLGLSWDAKIDQLGFAMKFECEKLNEGSCTKRKILKTLARIYDPGGFLSPFLIKGKIIFQKSWTDQKFWDAQVSHELENEWKEWSRQLKDLERVVIPRHMGIVSEDQFSLHVFSDASKEAYGACVYVKVGTSIQLVISKARVTPIRAQSVVRLELTAATLAVRLTKKTCDALNADINKVTFWVDAADVLFWLKRPAKQFKPFVSNRVSEIQSIVNASQFRYVPTKLNVADILTRGRDVQELLEEKRWWSGPEFLKSSVADWPPNIVSGENDTAKEELKEDKSTRPFQATAVIVEDNFPLHPSRWSSLPRLVQRTAYVLRFVNRCRKVKDETQGRQLHPTEMIRAEAALIKLCQMEAFSKERESLLKGQTLSRSSKLTQLNPFVDPTGLIRSKSRLHLITWLDDEFKCPIVMPKDHSFTLLLVKDAHERVGHPIGTNAALNELNKRFWVIGARVLLTKTMSKCPKCKMRRAKALQPAMGPLPEFRLAKPLHAFSVTSVDFAGPFLTKRGRGIARNKRYLVLFTCLQTRAVHLEMAYSLDTSSFLNAFSRFCDRRSCPTKVYSDNAKNFVRGAKEIKAKMLSEEDKVTGQYKTVEWIFQPPLAPHFGATHERMIRSAKRALQQVLEQADVSDEELVTAFVHVEGLLNSRPLTPASDQVADETCLTPNHFLFGRLNPGNVLESAREDQSMHPTRRWAYVQLLAQHFWLRWQKELLHTYITRTKWNRDLPNLKVGDLVMVLHPIVTNKRSWRLGRIARTYPGKDGVVRVVDLKSDGRVYRRPVNKLSLLESESI